MEGREAVLITVNNGVAKQWKDQSHGILTLVGCKLVNNWISKESELDAGVNRKLRHIGSASRNRNQNTKQKGQQAKRRQQTSSQRHTTAAKTCPSLALRREQNTSNKGKVLRIYFPFFQRRQTSKLPVWHQASLQHARARQKTAKSQGQGTQKTRFPGQHHKRLFYFLHDWKGFEEFKCSYGCFGSREMR